MSIEIRWLASLSASAFHAASAIVEGRTLVDPALEDALSEPTQELLDELDALGFDSRRMFSEMTALSIGIENNRELVDLAAAKIRGRHDSAGDIARLLAGRVADLEAAFRRTLPNAIDQLELRGKPLREQWEARGPGMLQAVGRQTEEALVPKSSDLALVYPVLGGFGAAHLPYNSVRIEAVLANPHEQLPETVRLAWLFSQLQMDIPIHSDQVARESLPRLAALSMLMPTLAAAEEVQLLENNSQSQMTALFVWRLARDQHEAEQLRGLLNDWWQTYQENPPRWAVALASLDRMLAELPSEHQAQTPMAPQPAPSLSDATPVEASFWKNRD